MVRNLFCLILAVFTLQARATPMPERYVPALRSMFVASQAPGMVAMVVDGGRTYVAGFGRTSPTDASVPDAHTLVRLNSLSKLFAGEVLAALIDERALLLGDRLQQHAPRGGVVPQHRSSRPITVRDLVTHTSGLARDVPVSVWDSGVPKEARWKWLARTKLLHVPGVTAEYSNAAWLFLGDAMEEVARTSYPELLSRHVLAPLALSDTTLAPNAAQCARLLSSGPVRCDPMQVTAPSWGIYSTPEDVSRWLQALMRAQPGTAMHRSLQDLMQRSDLRTAKGLDFAGRIEAIGYGWLRMRLGPHDVLQKTGGGGATMNYVILSPGSGRALFVTVSRMDIAMLRRLAHAANNLMIDIMSGTF